MGNELREKKSGICSSSDHENTGGCSWGLLHMIKYHHWRHFMKRLTHHHKRRHLLGNRTKKPSDEKMQEEDGAHMYKSSGGEKTEESLPRKSSSVRARIKSLLPEEIYKRKDRHNRSSSCPVQPNLTRIEPADLDPLADTLASDYQSHNTVCKNNKISLAANELDSLPITGYENCAECSKVVVGDQLEHDHVCEHQNMLERHNVDSFRSRPKEYLDALDIISTNGELLVKLLQDPGSPLAHHFQSQQALSAKRGFLAKAETFPLPGSPGRKGSAASRFKQMHEAEPGAEETAGVSHGTFSLSSVEQQRENQGETYVVSKSFKDLRNKIKDVIKESRKDMHRIAMDAIMHKIPHGKNMEEIDNKFRSSIVYGEDGTYCSVPSRNKNKLRLRQMRRASSLNNSLDRYCRLYETSPNREPKHRTSEGLKMRAKETCLLPKPLARIQSLPDLKPFVNQSEESFDAFSSGTPNKAPLDSDVGTESSFDEQKSPDFPVGSEDHELKTDASLESIGQENPVDLGAVNDVITDEAALTSTEDVEETVHLSSQMDDNGSLIDKEPETDPVLDGLATSLPEKVEELEMATPEVSETENAEPIDKHLTSDIPHLQVAAKDKAEFSYVKDVLELSGFSGNAFLGTWHSDEQPVDPSVYEEVKGCLVLDPDCCGNELGGKCDHLLLFDLINEVLIEIYARSYSYCPFALSSLSHISPMPSGPHVLREVWALISWYLSSTPEFDQSLDHVVGNDLSKSDGWMNLQFDSECVGIELEDLIFEDLLEELIWA